VVIRFKCPKCSKVLSVKDENAEDFAVEKGWDLGRIGEQMKN